MSMSSHKKKALPLLRLRWQKQRANGMYVQQYVQIYLFFMTFLTIYDANSSPENRRMERWHEKKKAPTNCREIA